MTSPTYLIRLTRVLLLGAVVAGTATSAAAASFSTPQGLKADGLRWQAIARAYQQSRPATSFSTPQGLKADGLRWQAIARAYQQAQAVERGSLSQSSGFDWGDYTIGIGSGMGLILALAGGLAIGWQRRHRIQSA